MNPGHSDTIYPVPDAYSGKAWITEENYRGIYTHSVDDNEAFWAEVAQRLDWIRMPEDIKDVSYDKEDLHIRWYADGQLNVCYNCVDRHLESRGEQTAIIWEGDDPDRDEHISYRQLYERVCCMANVIRELGVGKGDRVTIYMPMIPDAAIAMLACARIGAVHSVVFGGFSPDSLANRIVDCDSRLVITADEGVRGGKTIPLKKNVDAAANRQGVSEDMNAEDPLFILYTSGSTGKPKGVLHTTGGYLVYASWTHHIVFDYHEGDIYWCTADVGWVTGHSYIVYGPLANGAITLMFEGVPNYPSASRFWEVCDKHQVNICYTAPTAIRALMREGEGPVKSTSRKSLRLLGTVGEPINPEAWEWYYRIVGEKRCPIVDTWWQTETGGIAISPLPGATALKPGSATLPLPGIMPAIVDENGKVLDGPAEGLLVLTDSWPGQMRTVYGDHQRFIDTYFSTVPGNYFCGDGARRDEDGYYWITGRVDDVLNVSGHRLGTAEIESTLVAHPKVAEAAVVGYPHDIKGEGIYVYVTLNAGIEPSDDLKLDMRQWVRNDIGPIASPDLVQWAPALPKTRSGKIMRRILRKIAANDYDDLGDISTLAEPEVVDQLIEGRQNRPDHV
jgi:acetyl-CoA synthetase